MPKRNRETSVKDLFSVCGFPDIQYLSDDQEFNLLVHMLTNIVRDKIPTDVIRSHIDNFTHFQDCEFKTIETNRLICLVIMWMLKITWVDNPNEQIEKMYMVQEFHTLLHGDANKEIRGMEAEYMLYNTIEDALTYQKNKMQKATSYKPPADFVKAKKKYYEACSEESDKCDKLKEKLHPMVTKYKETCSDGFLKNMFEGQGAKSPDEIMKGFNMMYSQGKEETEKSNSKRNERLKEMMMEMLKETGNKKRRKSD